MKSSDVQSPAEQTAAREKRTAQTNKHRSRSVDWAKTPIEDVAEYNRLHDPFEQLRRAFPKRTRGGKSVSFDAARQRLHRALDTIMDRLMPRGGYSLADALDALDFPSNSRRISTHRSVARDTGKCGKACAIADSGRQRKLGYFISTLG